MTQVDALNGSDSKVEETVSREDLEYATQFTFYQMKNVIYFMPRKKN